MKLNAKDFIRTTVGQLKRTIGKDTAICATSGGVDSMVCAFLAYRALNRNLIALFIDDGLMREKEAEIVARTLRGRGVRTVVMKCEPQFYRALKGLHDPEQKRKAFRDTFYKTLGAAVRIHRAKYMIQGTIAADVIETKGKIKSQHNVLSQIGINPKKYGLAIVEPLVTLFKPDVRLVGKALGLSPAIYERMPFPGPGLATRVLGEVTPQRVKIVRRATRIVETAVAKLKPFQAFAVLLNDKATGVKNHRRVFGNIIVIRSVESTNAMTAQPTRIPYPVLEWIQKQIYREIPEVSKVLYDLSPKPPSTIEYI